MLNDRERDQRGGRGGGDRGASDPWLESVYEEALAYELELRGMTELHQRFVPVFYKG